MALVIENICFVLRDSPFVTAPISLRAKHTVWTFRNTFIMNYCKYRKCLTQNRYVQTSGYLIERVVGGDGHSAGVHH